LLVKLAGSRRLAPILFMLPAGLLFSCVVVWPILQTLYLSLFSWDGIGTRQYVGLGNYRELASDTVFLTALVNNVVWLSAFMLAPLSGLALAVFLNRDVVGIGFYRTMFYAPFVISPAAVGLIFTWFWSRDFGLPAILHEAFGLQPFGMLEDERAAIVGVVVAGLWPQTAYCMILFLAGLAALDRDLIEAGRLDGASGWRLFRFVVLPQLRYTTLIVAVVCAVSALRSFDLVSIMTNGGPYNSSNVLAHYMYEQTFLSLRFGYGAAIATVLLLLMTLCIGAFLRSHFASERL
jgi:multiple sugar transport system permease protein